MCSPCFSALDQFNDLRNIWRRNQEEIAEEQEDFFVSEDGTLEDVISEDETEDEIKIESEEQVIVDEVEAEFIDDIQLEDSFPDDDIENFKSESEEVVRIPQLRVKTERSSESKTKGKDIYQKSLQKCEICSKTLEKNRMDGHINKHNNIRPYICEDESCGKSFYCKLLLRLHRTSIHTGLLIECDVCKRTFASERSLYAHKLRHRNEDRYNCDHCERKFNNSNSLKRHLAIHSGIREFACPHCSSSFYRKFNLGKFE